MYSHLMDEQLGQTRTPRRNVGLAIVLALAVGIGAVVAASSDNLQSATSRRTPRPSVPNAVAGPLASTEGKDDAEVEGSAGEKDKRVILPRPASDRSLTAIPSIAAAGPAWTFQGPQPIANLTYTGPPVANWGHVSGRITSVVADPTNALTVYAGSAGGGVWKSINGGTNWTTTTSNQASLAIGAMAINATGTTIVAGTGEENFSDSAPGQGLLISKDSGATWTNIGRTTFGNHTIGGVAIDRATSGATMRIFVASDLGLYTSIDAGLNWTKNAQFSTIGTGFVTQVIQDPTTAAVWWATASTVACPAVTNGRVMRSTNNGTTWAAADTQSAVNRIALGVGPANVAYVAYANCSGTTSTIKKTINGGTTWTATGVAPNFLQSQSNYDNVVAVDPTNTARAVFGGVNIIATTNSGTTFTDVGKVYLAPGVIHPDFHAVAFTAANSFYVGNDGGMWKTANLGTAWTNLNNTLATTQFWKGTVTDLKHLLGGAQDNAVSGFQGTPNKSWTQYGLGGDGAYTAIDPTPGSTTIYTSSQNGSMNKSSSSTPISGTPAAPCGAGGCASSAFINPFVMDPTIPKRLLAGGNGAIFESRVANSYTGGVPAGTGGWTAISPILSPAGTTDVIVDIAVGGRGEGNVVYAATTLGYLFRSTDALGARRFTNGLAHWTNITGDLPRLVGTSYGIWDFVGKVAFNPWNIDEAWVATTYIDLPGQVKTARVWHTTNAGASNPHWSKLNGPLVNQPGVALAVDPRDPKVMYLGSSDGVYRCTSCAGPLAAGNWTKYGTGMPNVWVNDLTFTRDNQSLVAWTHGRGAWSLPTPDAAGTAQVAEFSVPGAGGMQAMTPGPSGPWFVDQAGIAGHALADGTDISYAVGINGDQLSDIVAGPDGNLWYTAPGGGYIGVVQPNGGGIVHYATLPGSKPTGIAVGPDLNLYITYTNSDAIAMFDPFARTFGGVFGTPTHMSRPKFITAGSDGNMWFTEFQGLKVGKMTLAGTFTEFPAPVVAGDTLGPFGIGLGPDGNVWFTNYQRNTLHKITPAGAITSMSMGTGIHGPIGVTIGPDGNLWVADGGAQNVVVRISPTTLVKTTYTTPTAFSSPWGIAAGPDGNIWFTESATGKVGRMLMSLAG